MSQFLLAQISDMHVLPAGRLCYGHSETNAKLRACIDAILALPMQPDVVLATGDLVHGGGREQYRCPREVRAPLAMLCYVAAGNHDDRAELGERSLLLQGQAVEIMPFVVTELEEEMGVVQHALEHLGLEASPAVAQPD